MDLPPGARVLDVAAGNGNATLAFARRWCDGDLDRLCRDAAGARPGPGRGRGARRSPGRWPMPSALPFADAQLRRRGLDLRRDVRAGPGDGGAPRCCGSAAPAGGSAWRTGRRRASSASSSARSGRHVPPPAGVKSPALWGSRPWIEETFGAGARGIARERAQLRLPLPLAGPLHRGVPHLVRAGAQGLPGARRGRAGGAGRRPARADRAVQHGDRRHDAGALGLWRGRS